MQESGLIERDAQLQSQNAEIRALRRQHAMDAEALKQAHVKINGRLRPSGSMGKPLAAQQSGGRRRQQLMSGVSSGATSPAKPDDDPHSPHHSPTGSPAKRPGTPQSTRRQLQQAIADKVRARYAPRERGRATWLTFLAACACATGGPRPRAASAHRRDGDRACRGEAACGRLRAQPLDSMAARPARSAGSSADRC